MQVEAIAFSEDSDIDGVPHIKATEALNLDVDLPTGTEAADMTQVGESGPEPDTDVEKQSVRGTRLRLVSNQGDGGG